MVRDSAGVRIVESRGRRPSWTWHLADSPDVTIGSANGPTLTRFDGIVGAVRLADGRIVVADGGNSELRFFDAHGRPLLAVGRSGSGPGEFRELVRLGVFSADSLYTYDDDLGRLSVFDDSGHFARSIHFPPDVVPFGDVRPTRDGGFLGTDGLPFYPLKHASEGRDTVHFMAFDSQGREQQPVADVLGRRFFIATGCNGRHGVGQSPFSPAVSWLVAADDLYVARGDRFQVDVFSLEGKLQAIIRRDHPLVADSAAIVTRYKQYLLSLWGSAARACGMRLLEQEFRFPRVLPAYSAVLLDPDGNLWVERFRPAEPVIHTVRWDVFAPDGAFRGTVAMPNDFDAFDIGRDYVLGRWKDSLGVEYVRLYSLRRGS